MARARRWGRWTLRAKWTLAVLVVSILPMVALGFVVLDIQRTGLSRAEKELEAAVVDEAATGVLTTLDQAADVALRVNRVFADDSLDVDVRTRMVRDIVSRAQPIWGIAFFDGERHFIDAVVKEGCPVDERFRIPPENGGYRTLMLPDGAAARFEAPLTGDVHGFVVVAIARDSLEGRLREISAARFATTDRVYLVDEGLNVIAGRSGAPARSIFEASGSRAKSFGVELLLTTEFNDGPTAMVGTIRTMPKQRWALVVERPTDDAFAALAESRRAFEVAVVALVVFAVLAAFVIIGRVLGPIASLMALVKRYARRDFDARSDLTSGDELEALGASLEHMADDLSKSEYEIEKRARIETNLRRYLPAEAADAAAKGAEESTPLDLGGAKRRVTVVFADVVAFTGFAESASPERAVAFLNELFTMLSEIVFRHDGMVDKFIGDCIMAVFRGDGDAPDDIARALAAADDMHAFVASNLPRFKEAYAFEVRLGIGIATGDVLMGNLGSESRMEYTVIGDAVNIAARLEALARPSQTLTTREVALACPDVTFTSLGEHALRGRAQPVEVFEVA